LANISLFLARASQIMPHDTLENIKHSKYAKMTRWGTDYPSRQVAGTYNVNANQLWVGMHSSIGVPALTDVIGKMVVFAYHGWIVDIVFSDANRRDR
jgi:hypothetical protein